MAEYIERGTLIRNIVCDMAEFVGAPDDVLKHDEQCNYAINMIEYAPSADVAPVVHGRWVHLGGDEWCCSACGFVITTEGSWDKPTKKYCEDCGARMDGGDNGAAD